MKEEAGSSCMTPRNLIAVSVKQFWQTRDSRIKSPPHILLIYPQHTFSYSPKIKSTLKWRFEDTDDIKRNVTKELLALLANEFKKCFQQFYERAQTCYISRRLFSRILTETFDFKSCFLKMYEALELNCLTMYAPPYPR
jgi:hypothetical protein